MATACLIGFDFASAATFFRNAALLELLTSGMLAPLLGSFGRLLERLGSRRALGAGLAHLFARPSGNALALGVNVSVQPWLFHPQFHRFMLARARSAFLDFATTPPIRAQNDFLRAASALVLGCGAGALRLLPVARLYLARPLAVNPAPLLTESFSPRPTANDTLFFAIYAPIQPVAAALGP
jgi:hypothetical protein